MELFCCDLKTQRGRVSSSSSESKFPKLVEHPKLLIGACTLPSCCFSENAVV
ncbi:hypothetical protein CRG98_028867 [Punica granatum]|uniref:Uncharacterized protein n=1 Tax=Punica granatum TaxID=22663 RepID=A0A2I0J3B8_PUNGR|nr:hypothetical protein CRG98_028867 [Punica granatum]